MSTTYLLVGDEKKGPYSDGELLDMFSAGTITAETLHWREGMTDWAALGPMDVPPTVTTIAPPRRLKSAGQSKPGYVVDPHEKERLKALSARTKPMTLMRALMAIIIFFVVLTILIEVIDRIVPDAGKLFAEQISAATARR